MRYVFGDYELDTQTCELRCAGTLIALPPKAYAVLVYLIEHRDRLIPKDELLEALWPGTYVDDSAIKRNVMLLRRALTDHAETQPVIKTQRGQGYRFIPPVTLIESGPQRPATAAAAASPLPADTTRLCTACQRGNPITARFCVYCGAVLTIVCPQCTEALRHPAAFCPACGLRLADSVAVSATSQPRATLPFGAEMGGNEPKLVTILHCACTNATSLVASGGLDALHDVMQTAHNLARTAAQRYGGTLQPLTGESFVILFGAPLAQEDHALRALLAALSLQQPLDVTATFGIGLHSGRVIVGQPGPEQSGPMTVVGDVTTWAGAIAHQAPPGGVVASAATLRLVPGDVDASELAPLRIADQAATWRLYHVHHVTPLRMPSAAVPLRRVSPFVGRQEELALLHARFRQVQQGRGQVVAISGEPGIGKSRLLHEFSRTLAPYGIVSLRGHCQSYGQSIPYLPLRELLRLHWGLSGSDSPAVLAAKLHRGLQATGLDPQTWMPCMQHLFEIEPAAGSSTTLPPDVLKARTFEVLQQLIRHCCRQRPALLVIEDLHWIDATSAAFVDTLVERLIGLPVLLLVTLRAGSRPVWLDRSYATQLALQPLAMAACRQMVHAALPLHLRSSEFEAQMLAKADGNPFFLEELLHTTVEQPTSTAVLAVPDTIQAVLASRLDRLPVETRQVLQTAAVIGHEVPLSLLCALTNSAAETLEPYLAQLQAGEFLYATPSFPDPVYAFKHALTLEVVYGSLLQARRQALHRRIVETLETVFSDRLADHVDRLAHHARSAMWWDKAWRYFHQAGRQAMLQAANQEAVRNFEQALQCLERLPVRPETQTQAVDVRLDLRNALLQLGENERCLEVLRQAHALIEDLDDARRLGWLSSFMSTHHLLLGDSSQALACGERALAIAAMYEDMALQVDTRLHLGQAYHARGMYSKAIDLLRCNVEILTDPALQQAGRPTGLLSLHSLPWLVWCLAEVGAFQDGRAYGVEAIRLAEASKHPYGLVPAYGCAGLLELRQGDVHKAMPLLERSLDLCQQAHFGLMLPVLAASLGTAYARSGRLTTALPLLEQAVTQATGARSRLYQGFVVAALSEGYFLAGHLTAAYQHAQQALTLCQTYQEDGQRAWVLCLLGDIAQHRAPLAMQQAETFYQQAMAQAHTLGMRPLLARCHAGLSTLYHRQGWVKRARSEHATAAALFDALGMTFQTAPTDTSRGQLD